MLVSLTRASTSNALSINPEGVAALFAARNPEQTVLRMADGPGFTVIGPLAEVRAKLGGDHLVGFNRAMAPEAHFASQHDEFEEGEDDAMEAPPAQLPVRPIFLNPRFVAAAFQSRQHPGEVIVRMFDGRGFRLSDPLSVVQERLGVDDLAEGEVARGERV